MTLEMAQKLLNTLIRNCPVDSGALKQSITIVQFSAKEFVIQIGNESGKEINGSSATNVYAAYTNAKYLKHRVKGSDYLMKLTFNRNYRWVNKSIEEWINTNKLNLTLNVDEEEEEIENGEI